MKALFIRGTTRRGAIVNEGDEIEMEEHEFRSFELAGNAIRKPEEPPAPVVEEAPAPEPVKKSVKRRKRGK